MEQHFYMLISPLLLLIPSAYHRISLVVLMIGSMAAMWGHYFAGDHPMIIYLSSPGNFFFMAAGGLLALRSKNTGESGRFPDLWIFLLAFSVALILARSPIRTEMDRPLFRVLFAHIGLVVGMTLLRFIVLNPRSRLVALLELPPVRYLGVISYGFYVYHNLIPLFHTGIPGPIGKLLSLSIHFTIIFALSAASWHFVESKLLGRKPTSIGAQPATA